MPKITLLNDINTHIYRVKNHGCGYTYSVTSYTISVQVSMLRNSVSGDLEKQQADNLKNP